jgi:transcription elongation GreA/GreB family factor
MKLGKKQILEQLEQQLKTKGEEIQEEIDSMNTELGNETKSSAGDKFETTREMMNQEIDRLEGSLSKNKQQQQNLQGMMETDELDTVDFGAFVKTNEGNFLFGLAVGKVTVEEAIGNKQDNAVCWVLSLNSPIGKAFCGKKVGEEFAFLDKNYLIQAIF